MTYNNTYLLLLHRRGGEELLITTPIGTGKIY